MTGTYLLLCIVAMALTATLWVCPQQEKIVLDWPIAPAPNTTRTQTENNRNYTFHYGFMGARVSVHWNGENFFVHTVTNRFYPKSHLFRPFQWGSPIKMQVLFIQNVQSSCIKCDITILTGETTKRTMNNNIRQLFHKHFIRDLLSILWNIVLYDFFFAFNLILNRSICTATFPLSCSLSIICW